MSTADSIKTISYLSAILDSVPTAVVVVDQNGAIVLVNTQTENLFGYSRGQLLGEPVDLLVPNRFRRHHPEMRSGYIKDPKARPMGAGRDLYGLRKDGSEFPVEIGLNPITTSEGLFVVSAIVDITERKRLEERFRATVESAPTAMIMIDQTGAIVLVNAEAVRLFGYDRGELLLQKVEALIPERFREGHPRLRSQFFASPQARSMGAGRDLFARHKNGSEFPVEIGLNPIHTDEGSYVLAAIVDMTERKRLEKALRESNEELERRVRERTLQLTRQTEELQLSNEALVRSNLDLQRFAYIASHDLQSPLRSIAGFVQLLQMEYKGKLDDQADDWIRRTVKSVERLQNSIQDLLAYARVDSQSQPFAPISLNDVFREVLLLLDAPIRDADAKVVRGELPTVLGDRSQLVQLLQNLIGNSLKYRGDDSPRVHVSAKREDREWIVSVRDNGIGVDPKHHERIFEIFHRTHSQEEYPGSGIGLAVCRRVVHRMGGRIWVESAPKKGSVFYFTIPEIGKPV